MVSFKRTVIVCTFAFGAFCNANAQGTFPDEGIKEKEVVYTLYTGGEVHHADGKVEVADFLVYRGQITAYGEKAKMSLPENVREKNLAGLHVYPSFIDMKSTYGLTPFERDDKKKGPQPDRLHNKATYWNESIHPETRAIDRFEPEEKAAAKLRGMGIGATLSALDDGVARGSSVLVLAGDALSNKLVVKPEVAAHFSFEKGKSRQDYPSSLMGAMALLRQAIYDARWYADGPKEEVNYSLEQLHHQLSGTLIFDGRDKYDLYRLGKLAREFDLDFIAYEPGHAYENVEALDPHITGLIVPMKLPKPFDTDDPDLLRFVDQADMLHWERAPYNPIMLADAGIPFAFTAHGFQSDEDFFADMRRLIKTGLPENVLLEAWTTAPAAMCSAEAHLGALAPGYFANFFTTTANIFTDEDAKVVDHYIRGKAHAVTPQADVVLAGLYDLNVDNHYFNLKVKGKHPGYEAELSHIADGDTTKVEAEMALLGRELSLSFANPEGPGRYRLSASARSNNRIWDGMGAAPDGREIKWSAIRKAEKNPSNPSAADSTAIEAPSFPAARFPLAAYGHDSLPKAERIWIKNAILWTNDSLRVMHKAEMIVDGGIIRAVGHNLDPLQFFSKKEAEKLKEYDAQGKHITPGIIDEHSHIAISRGVNEGTQACTAEVRIEDALNPGDINIFRQLAGGVTTSQLLHGSANPIGGQSAIIKLRWGRPYAEMLFAEAPGFIKFALGENVKQTNWGERYTTRYPQTRMGVEQVFYDYFYRAREYGQELKLHEASSAAASKKLFRKKESGPPSFRRDLELEALLEIMQGERHITCHSYVQSEINMLMHVADSMGFKVNTFTHILEGYKLADKMKAHGAAGSTFSDWWAYKYEVKDAIPHNASLMQELGVLVGINSDDAEMGRRLNQEASKGIKYGGMTEEEALKMVTLNPARMMHIDHLVGSLQAGKHADFVVWSDHPLSTYAVAERTYIDGCLYFDRSQLPSLMQRDQAERMRIADSMKEASSKGGEKRKPERTMERYYHCDHIEEQ